MEVFFTEPFISGPAGDRSVVFNRMEFRVSRHGYRFLLPETGLTSASPDPESRARYPRQGAQTLRPAPPPYSVLSSVCSFPPQAPDWGAPPAPAAGPPAQPGSAGTLQGAKALPATAAPRTPRPGAHTQTLQLPRRGSPAGRDRRDPRSAG